MPPNQPADAQPAAAPAAPAAAVPRLDDVLGFQLARASISTTHIFVRVAGIPLELRPVEFVILALIRESPGLSPARLAQQLAVTAPNITVWITRLEKRGLIRRQASVTDRRAQVLTATLAGEQMSVDATQRLVAAEREAFAALSRGERMLLAELLQKVAAAREP